MWERAEGIKAYQCLGKKAKFTKRGLANLRLGLGPDELLRKAGQPLRRTQAWTYCVKAGKGNYSADAVLTPEGSVALVASNAPGHRVRGIGAGAKVARLKGRAKPIGHKIWIAKLGKHRVAYVVRKGTVRRVAVAARSLRGRKALRRYLNLIPGGKAPQHPHLLPVDRTITNRNAEPLRLQRAAKQVSFVCGLAAAQSAAPRPGFAVRTSALGGFGEGSAPSSVALGGALGHHRRQLVLEHDPADQGGEEDETRRRSRTRGGSRRSAPRRR